MKTQTSRTLIVVMLAIASSLEMQHAKALGASAADDVAAAEKDFQEIKARAEKGDAWAQLEIADYYRSGTAVDRNYEEALKWARKSADQNYPMAQYLVAGFYSQGWGIEKNAEESFKWLLKAAFNGLDLAQKAVSFAYFIGNGVKQDNIESYAWLSIASKKDKDAAQKRDNMEKWMPKPEVIAAQKRTTELSAQIRK